MRFVRSSSPVPRACLLVTLLACGSGDDGTPAARGPGLTVAGGLGPDRLPAALERAVDDLVGAVLREGQCRGEVRTDLDLDDLVDFLVEQTYLAAESIDRSENTVRKRFRRFVTPALEAHGCCGGEHQSRVTEVEYAVAAAQEALENLTQKLSTAQAVT